jgi:hypothetical protein
MEGERPTSHARCGRPRTPAAALSPTDRNVVKGIYSRRSGRQPSRPRRAAPWRLRSRATSTTRVEGTRLPTLARDRCSGGAGSRSRAPPGRTPAARGASGRRGRARCSPFLILPNSRMCGIVNSRSAGIWTARRPGVMGRHGLRRLLNPPRRSLDRVSPGGPAPAHVLGSRWPELKYEQSAGQFPRPVRKSALSQRSSTLTSSS